MLSIKDVEERIEQFVGKNEGFHIDYVDAWMHLANELNADPADLFDVFSQDMKSKIEFAYRDRKMMKQENKKTSGNLMAQIRNFKNSK